MAFDAIEEALDDLRFRGIGLTQTPHLEGFTGTPGDRDRDHALLFVGEELMPHLFPPLGLHDVTDLLVGEIAEVVQAPTELYVRDGFDIENENVHDFFMRTATATTRPASSVSVICPSPMPIFSHSARPRSDQMMSGRPHAFGANPESRIHMPCANPV